MSTIAAPKPLNNYEVDCSNLVKDNLLSVSEFLEFMQANMKINRKTNNLTENISLSTSGASLKIENISGVRVNKRYIKYLSNKFLYQKQLRDWVRVVSGGKECYKMEYFNVEKGKDE
ncbi:ribosomal protein L22 [Hamiltosporidium tvaerminnensis]|uniref:Large ribosomal subunit protein eL22 n=2 Tax=Hamiltosporidium TaxID=1176354 RepID=A0A4Q9LJ44_9MICR|nr:60S ribosomal protein L22 [Hamiltosporidium tvaerminnensis]TBU01644.1 ribosomal protein L22 [Hamiltosporidium tvaerminnensis]TBU05672.1 ribosomal protein L22 [Hamiltosporidium magnivora]TBU08218.1 ribosomal protein L22 [Hamiltosporidium magnivora]TBU20341.1 ribosomal protein L22 [Hamiltosporidium tvaerminnensis]